jgi:hypothetical protein
MCNLLTYLMTSELLPRFQAVYQLHHSTEATVLKVQTDSLLVTNNGNLGVLAWSDLSTASNATDQRLLTAISSDWQCIGSTPTQLIASRSEQATVGPPYHPLSEIIPEHLFPT